MKFQDFFEKLAWLVMTAAALFVSKEMNNITTSVNMLNTNVAVIVAQIKSQDKLNERYDREFILLREEINQIKRRADRPRPEQ